jgi:hypothetical protein
MTLSLSNGQSILLRIAPTKSGGKSLLKPNDFRMKVSVARRILVLSDDG